MKTAILALCLVVAFAMVPTATQADHETTDCDVTSSEPTVEAGGIAIFVDSETSVWIYQESNEIEGFQRADSVVGDDLCGHDGDTIIL